MPTGKAGMSGSPKPWVQVYSISMSSKSPRVVRRFYFGKLNVSERSTRIAKDLLVLEETPNYRLSGKTGWAGLGETSAPQIGWLVGYLERAGKVYFVATNVDIEKKEDAAARLSITKAILRDLGLIED